MKNLSYNSNRQSNPNNLNRPKRIKSNSKIFNMMLALMLVCVLASTLFACNNNDDTTLSTDKFSVTGRVTLDGNAFANVNIAINDRTVELTSADGLYLLRDLERGDIVAFTKDGFSFSPSEHIVTGDCYDLNVLATLAAPPDDPDPGTDPEDEDPIITPKDPDDSDPDDKDPEIVPKTALLPIENMSFLQNSNVVSLILLIDKDANSFAVNCSYEKAGETLSTTPVTFSATFCFTSLQNDYTADATANGITISAEHIDDATVGDSDYYVVLVDLTPLLTDIAVYTFSVTARSDELTDSGDRSISFINLSGEPFSIDSVSFETGMLSWSAAALPSGIEVSEYMITANGVLFASTTCTRFGFTDLTYDIKLPDSFDIQIYAFAGDILIAMSDPLTVSLI